MNKLVHELNRPNAGPQWAPVGEPSAIQAKFGREKFALVLGIRWDDKDRAPQIANREDDVPLQVIAPGDGWVSLTAPPPAAGDSHLLVMGWMRVRPVTGGNHIPFTATWAFFGLPPPSLHAEALQEALDQWHSQQPIELERCLLALPAASAVPGANHQSARSASSVSSTAEQDTQFAFASCQYPAGLFDRPSAGASFDRLEHALAATSTQPPIAALLLLGDQIYADATYGILDPARQEDRYGEAYRAYDNALRMRTHLSQLANSGRLYVTPDDHEFSDNWEPGPGAAAKTALKDGVVAFDAERAGPLPPRQASGGYWGAVAVGGGHEVFILDTRTQREARPWGPGSAANQAHIINLAQRTALETWLRRLHKQDQASGTVTPKFIASAVWLLPRSAGRPNPAGGIDHTPALSDAWDGYPPSLHGLLGFIAQNQIRGVVVLCGDGHLAGHTVVQLVGHQPPQLVPVASGVVVTVHVLHAPALYAPFPFANARPHEYATQEQFSWGLPNQWVVCNVSASLWPLGDGFVQVAVQWVGGAWEVRAHFDTRDQPRSEHWTIG